jgi:hypothetical protein
VACSRESIRSSFLLDNLHPQGHERHLQIKTGDSVIWLNE